MLESYNFDNPGFTDLNIYQCGMEWKTAIPAIHTVPPSGTIFCSITELRLGRI